MRKICFFLARSPASSRSAIIMRPLPFPPTHTRSVQLLQRPMSSWLALGEWPGARVEELPFVAVMVE